MRFPGFEEEWNSLKLNEFTLINPKSIDLPNDFIYIDLESVVEGNLIKESRIRKKEAPSRAQRVLKKHDIIYQTVRPYQKNNLFFNKTGSYVASTGYAQLRTKQNALFLFQYLHNQDFVDKVIERCTGTSYPAINSTDLGQIIIKFPNIEEQKKIGEFLYAFDNKIQTQKKTISELEKYIQILRDELFSQKIRFNNHLNEHFPKWSEQRLEDICEKQSSSISANSIEDNIGEFPIFGATGFLKNIDFYQVESEYIAIIKDGAGVGRMLYCKEKSSVLGTLDILKAKDINLQFLFYLLSRIDFSKYSTGSTIPHIYFKDYKNEKVKIPCTEEQNKIATSLLKISEKINVEKNILILIEQQKKYFLQNLFI